MTTYQADACLYEFIENRHEAWERVRTICYYTYFTAPGAEKDMDMKKMMPFSWDKKEEIKIPTVADKKRLEQLLKLT